FTRYDQFACRAAFQPRPVARRCCPLSDSRCQLSSAISIRLEKGFAQVNAIQPQASLGAGFVYRTYYRCLWRAHAGAAQRNAEGRKGSLGTHLLHWRLLDGEDSGGQFLLLTLGLAYRKRIRYWACAPD